MNFSHLVYLLCALTSTACSGLLIRAHIRNPLGILFWSAVCFVGLSLNNWGLFADLVIFPSEDYSLLRTLPALVGLGALIYGLVWEVK